MELVQCFNECVGVISDFTGVCCEPEKGIRCYNIKAALFNLTSLSLIYGLGLMILSDPLIGLVVSSVSFAAKIFIHVAVDKTFFGAACKQEGDFFFKKFLTL